MHLVNHSSFFHFLCKRWPIAFHIRGEPQYAIESIEPSLPCDPIEVEWIDAVLQGLVIDHAKAHDIADHVASKRC